jgi:RNA polymerase sigma-70 factor (ECF subfamily)
MADLSSAAESERERTAPNQGLDDDLAVRARRFEPEALAQLHDEYFERIYGFVFARIGNHSEAEEVAGQVFLRVLDSLPRFRGSGAALAPWLYKVAQEVLMARYPRPRQPAATPELPDHSPEARLQGIREAISELPEPMQTVLMLRLVAGLDAAQVASATGRRLGTVQALQRRALKQLRSILGRRGLL